MIYKKFLKEYGASYRVLPGSNRKVARPPPSQFLRDDDLGDPVIGFISLYPWEGEYLFHVARRARVAIVEVGRFKGGSTLLVACAAPKVPIYSIDCSPQYDERLQQIFEATGEGRNVDLIVGDSQRGQFPYVGPYDVLFIDGDHSYEGITADISNWYGGLAKNGHMLFHDSHKPGVQDAIADFITAHPEAHVLLTPFMGPSYWENPHGSLAHIIKPGNVSFGLRLGRWWNGKGGRRRGRARRHEQPG
jgi:hypothetical protein